MTPAGASTSLSSRINGDTNLHTYTHKHLLTCTVKTMKWNYGLTVWACSPCPSRRATLLNRLNYCFNSCAMCVPLQQTVHWTYIQTFSPDLQFFFLHLLIASRISISARFGGLFSLVTKNHRPTASLNCVVERTTQPMVSVWSSHIAVYGSTGQGCEFCSWSAEQRKIIFPTDPVRA